MTVMYEVIKSYIQGEVFLILYYLEVEEKKCKMATLAKEFDVINEKTELCSQIK